MLVELTLGLDELTLRSDELILVLGVCCWVSVGLGELTPADGRVYTRAGRTDPKGLALG